jgi:molybdenum cofactor biosynthesis enzyme MoaA
MDVKTMRSSKCINRLKNYNLDNAKISLRKLPADFFQPSTNSNKNLNVIHIVNR